MSVTKQRHLQRYIVEHRYSQEPVRAPYRVLLKNLSSFSLSLSPPFCFTTFLSFSPNILFHYFPLLLSLSLSLSLFPPKKKIKQTRIQVEKNTKCAYRKIYRSSAFATVRIENPVILTRDRHAIATGRNTQLPPPSFVCFEFKELKRY